MNILGVDLWIVVKIMFIVGMLVYVTFAFVVIRQVGHMTKTLKVGFETPVRLLALMHFIVAIGLLILSVLYL